MKPFMQKIMAFRLTIGLLCFIKLTVSEKIISVAMETNVEVPSIGPSVKLPLIKPDEIVGSASAPEPVSVAEPNLGALLGIGSLAGAPGLLSNIRGRSLSGGSLPQQSLPDVSSLCGSNSDALSNLLVYQYLSGSIPQGGAALPNGATSHPAIAANPNIQALLNGEVPGTTSTAVTTTVTTRVITMEASTKYVTSTTSYTTTVTQTSSTVLPIIFRGSKITTTITDKSTEVLTATEFKTHSTVIAPSIVQTLPVEITLLHRSTIGLDGQYTLDKIKQGATKVIEKPISTSNVNFDTKGLDLSGIDLSKIDLSSLAGVKNEDMLRSLTALLDKYKDEDRPDDRGRDRNRDRGREDPRRPSTRRNEGNRFRYSSRRPSSNPPEDDQPKFNVLRGFTYSDRPAEQKTPREDPFTGTASLSTRYSKFRKKDTVRSNNVRPPTSDRESEPFSATTSRRTVRPSSDRRSNGRPSRFQKEGRSSIRRNRQVEADRRRTGRTLHKEKKNTINHITIQHDYKPSYEVKTTILTMYMTGPRPGQTNSIERTVTLRNLANRVKRDATNSPSPVAEKILATENLQPPSSVSPSDVITLLKGLSKDQVKEMLGSLHNWVDYYIENVLDEPERSSLLYNRYRNLEKNTIPELSSSYQEENITTNVGTTILPSLPNTITKNPSVSTIEQSMLCPKPVTVTETVYMTVNS